MPCQVMHRPRPSNMIICRSIDRQVSGPPCHIMHDSSHVHGSVCQPWEFADTAMLHITWHHLSSASMQHGCQHAAWGEARHKVQPTEPACMHRHVCKAHTSHTSWQGHGSTECPAGAESESVYALPSITYWMPTEAVFPCPHISNSLLTLPLNFIYLSENRRGGVWK